GWDGWSIFKASENKEAAWTFLKWLMSVEASEYYAEQGGTNVPVREDVAASGSFLDDAPEGTELIATAIDFATPVPSPDQQALVDTEVNKGWEAAILGNQPVAEALSTANEAMQELLGSHLPLQRSRPPGATRSGRARHGPTGRTHSPALSSSGLRCCCSWCSCWGRSS